MTTARWSRAQVGGPSVIPTVGIHYKLRCLFKPGCKGHRPVYACPRINSHSMPATLVSHAVV